MSFARGRHRGASTHEGAVLVEARRRERTNPEFLLHGSRVMLVVLVLVAGGCLLRLWFHCDDSTRPFLERAVTLPLVSAGPASDLARPPRRRNEAPQTGKN